MSGGRRKPYTERGIRRVPCFRCGKPSRFQWQICADGNVPRGLCAACDVGLNALVLRWMRDPDAARKVQAYRKRVSPPAPEARGRYITHSLIRTANKAFTDAGWKWLRE